MIPGDLLSAFPHRQFHTLPGLLDSWVALPNSNPNACMPMQGGSLYHFYDGLWCDPPERRTYDLPCERRTRYRLSQPETVKILFLKVTVPIISSYSRIICSLHLHVSSYIFRATQIDVLYFLFSTLSIHIHNVPNESMYSVRGSGFSIRKKLFC